MPPASEPAVWVALEKIRTNLAAITAGSSYWYTPHRVQVIRGGQGEWDPKALEGELGTIGSDPATVYLVRRGSRQLGRQQTGTNAQGSRDRARVAVQVLVAQRFTPETDADTPTEALVIERMLADVIRALSFVDPGLGVSIDADDVFGADDGPLEEMPTNWAVGVIQLEVSYDYFSERP
jgi:hypothetical protein